MFKFFSKIKYYFVGSNKTITLFVILLLYSFLYIQYIETQNKIITSHLETLTSGTPPKDYTLVNNELVNLKKQNKELQDAINFYKEKKQEVKYIIKTETKLTGEKIVYKTIPEEYIFKLNKEIPVAKFSSTDKYKFETYDLIYKTYTVISEKDTLIKVTATSSADNIERAIETTNSIVYENKNSEENKIFKPNIMLGISANSNLNINATVGLSLLKSRNDLWRILMVETSFNKENINVGITPIQFNIGKPVPLVSNLWIGAGYQTNLINHYGTVNLTTEL